MANLTTPWNTWAYTWTNAKIFIHAIKFSAVKMKCVKFCNIFTMKITSKNILDMTAHEQNVSTDVLGNVYMYIP